jgi:hypothetical protein
LVSLLAVACKQKLDVNRISGTWVTSDPAFPGLTPLKVVFSEHSAEVFHLLSEDRPEMKAWSDSTEENSPWSQFYTNVRSDTIFFRYRSKFLDSTNFYNAIYKMYKYAEDTLILFVPNDNVRIKLVRVD